MTIQLAQHQTTGESYVIAWDDDGRVQGIAGPYSRRAASAISGSSSEAIALCADRNDDDLDWADAQRWNLT
jgi:predicted ATP-grasp superfamily ATP-dependent carboligase